MLGFSSAASKSTNVYKHDGKVKADLGHCMLIQDGRVVADFTVPLRFGNVYTCRDGKEFREALFLHGVKRQTRVCVYKANGTTFTYTFGE